MQVAATFFIRGLWQTAQSSIPNKKNFYLLFSIPCPNAIKVLNEEKDTLAFQRRCGTAGQDRNIVTQKHHFNGKTVGRVDGGTPCTLLLLSSSFPPERRRRHPLALHLPPRARQEAAQRWRRRRQHKLRCLQIDPLAPSLSFSPSPLCWVWQ